VLRKTAAAVEFDGGVAVVDLEVQEFCVVLARRSLGKIEKLRANSLSAARGFDEEFVKPGAFAAIFETVFEADNQITDGGGAFPRDIGDAVDGIFEKFGEIGAEGGFVEGFGPGIIELQMAHHFEQGLEIVGGGLRAGIRFWN